MTYDEAIKLLHPSTTGDEIEKIEFLHGFNGKVAAIQAIEEASLLACEALEKQIPKKPEAIYQKGTMWTGDCPLCNQKQSYGSIEWHRFFNKFCLKCGQALDWSDNDAEPK